MTNSIRFTLEPEGYLRTPEKKRARRTRRAILSARLGVHVSLESPSNGQILACFHGRSVDLGKFSADAAGRAQDLHTGLPLSSFATTRRTIDKEVHLLVQRLARHGLLEYCLGRP